MSTLHRPYISTATQEQVKENAYTLQSDGNGHIVSPNGTGEYVSQTNGQIGHRSGFESRSLVEYGQKAGLTQSELNQLVQSPGLYQYEPKAENISHVYEEHDHNQAMLNVNAYAVSQDSNLATHTYISPPDNNGISQVMVENEHTGEMNLLGEYESVNIGETAYIQNSYGEYTSNTYSDINIEDNDIGNSTDVDITDSSECDIGDNSDYDIAE